MVLNADSARLCCSSVPSSAKLFFASCKFCICWLMRAALAPFWLRTNSKQKTSCSECLQNRELYGFTIRLVQNLPIGATYAMANYGNWCFMISTNMFCWFGIVGIVPRRFGQGRLAAKRERERHCLCKWRFLVEDMSMKDLYGDELPCTGLEKSPGFCVFKRLVG